MMFDPSFIETLPDDRPFDPRGQNSLAHEGRSQRRGPTGITGSRGVFEPILRASQARRLCALMDECRRLGSQGPDRRARVGEVSAWSRLQPRGIMNEPEAVKGDTDEHSEHENDPG